jgi:hypothetical protein
MSQISELDYKLFVTIVGLRRKKEFYKNLKLLFE